MLVRQPCGRELTGELGVEDLLEQVLELPVVGLQDRVLGGQVDRVVALEAVAEAGPGEVADRVVVVVHPHGDAAVGAVVGDLELHRLAAVVGGEGHRDGAGARHLEVGRLVLIAVGMTADDDRLRPTGDELGDVRADDRLAEHDAAEDVADRAVRRPPHLLQAELLDPGLVRRDRGALDADAVTLDRLGGVDRDLVLGGVTVFDAEVEVVELDVEVRQDQAILDELPDDPRHLVAVELDDGVLDLDLRHVELLARRGTCTRLVEVQRAGRRGDA